MASAHPSCQVETELLSILGLWVCDSCELPSVGVIISLKDSWSCDKIYLHILRGCRLSLRGIHFYKFLIMMQLICNDMGRTRRLTSPSSLALAGGAVDFSSLSLSSVSHKRGVYKHADSVG